jgi:FlaA1/EpsC-like NDP-sugar epimerase
MRSARAGRRLALCVWDIGVWTFSVPLAAALRYDFALPPDVIWLAFIFGLFAGLTQVLLGLLLGLYRGRYVVGSFDEMWGVITVAAMTAISFFGFVLWLAPDYFARSIPVISGGIACGVMVGGRVVRRFWYQKSALKRPGQRVLIYGAGDVGAQIASLLISDKSLSTVPVGFLDDDEHKRHLRLRGLRVLGNIDDIEGVQSLTQSEILLVAIPSMPASQLFALDQRCSAIGLKLRITPSTSEIIDGTVNLGDISDVREEDLLGRRPVKTDESLIESFLHGKRVLITGAGGSIGSEIARQVYRYTPSEVGFLDRDESSLHALQLSIDGQGLLTDSGLLLADIRDERRISELFSAFQPDVVFHAAALKHLPLLEASPSEAFKTNVLGTRNVLSASVECGAQAVINISTDKAADPSSVLGFSKLVTERMSASLSQNSPARLVSVRFGNVLGSRGSVLDTFRNQIARGGPLTVTHPDVTRYFMTIPEAVHLVLQAGALGESGETLILDMGSPVRIDDVAKTMIQRSGRSLEIVYTGLREGEKMHEALVSTTEVSSQRVHPLIAHTRARPCSMDLILDFDPTTGELECFNALRRIAIS